MDIKLLVASAIGLLFLLLILSIWTFHSWKTKSIRKSWIWKKYDYLLGDSLYRNSLYLMLNSIIVTGLGFFFWMINTRLFSTEDIGLATALISVMGVITGLSLLGLNVGLIRYLPSSKRKNEKINTVFTSVMLSSIIVASIFLIFVDAISPELGFLRKNIIFSIAFIAFMIIASFDFIIDSIFTAYRNTKYILVKNTIFGIFKLIFPFFLIFLGAYGIFSSWMVSMLIALIISFIILIVKFNYVPKFEFHKKTIKDIGKYSFGNYVSGFIGGLPIMILPLLILNKLGAELVAYYYIAMMIAGLLFIIPHATSQSLFVEGSYSEKELGRQIKKAVKIISLLLIPAIILIVFFGQYLLMLFGKEYAIEGFRFLQVIAVGGIFVGVNAVFISIFKVQKRIKEILFKSIIGSTLIIGLTYLFLSKGSGLSGVGYAWIIGQITISLVFTGMWKFSKKSKSI